MHDIIGFIITWHTIPEVRMIPAMVQYLVARFT